MRPVLVVGLGNPDRGDDGVGPVVAGRVAALTGPEVEVVSHEDPTDLTLLWEGRELVVVVDALRSGVAPGTVLVLRTGADRPPLGEDAWARTGRGGTHAFGLVSAVELGRALGRLPREVTVVGVEAGSLEYWPGLTPEVAAAVPAAAVAVLEAISTAARARACTDPTPRA